LHFFPQDKTITKLPKAEHDAQEWQAAMQALLLVADTRRERCDEPQLDCVSV
jgi:hypothetical protein